MIPRRRAKLSGVAAPCLALWLGACSSVAPQPAIPASTPAAGAPLAQEERPNWVIIAPDSMRADRLGPLPDGSVPAPNLSRLAGEGVVFSNAFSQSGWTAPALASLLTGRYPTVLGFGTENNPNSSWSPGVRTVPEILTIYGYQTAAFWGDTMAGVNPAFSVGFGETFRSESAGLLPDQQDVKEWITHKAHAPFFLVVHNFDLRDQKIPPPPITGSKSFLDAYDNTVRRYDAEFLDLRQWLADAGFGDDTVLVVVSNHGLDFFGHGPGISHGTLYDSVLRVPLAIIDPRATVHGVNDTVVQGIDLAPTILARSGVPPEVAMDGHSLLPFLGGSGTYTAGDVYSQTNAQDRSVRTERYKLISCHGACCGTGVGVDPLQCTGPEEYRLYDLEADPAEVHDLARSEPDVLRTCAAKLDAWEARYAGQPSGPGQFAVSASQKKLLQDGGYWGLMFPGDPPAAVSP